LRAAESRFGAPMRIVREMAVSHAEFLRTLPAAFPADACRVSGSEITCEEEGRRLVIRLGPEREQRFGSLTLPMTTVEMEFTGCSEEQAKRILVRFDACFRRGGG
jgi:hypothetical protein